MTKPVTRKMAVDCLLWLIQRPGSLGMSDGVAVFRCYICGDPVLPEQTIQFDHIHAVTHDGPHEYQNLRPVHYDPCHKAKSKKDVAAKAKGDRILGLTKTKPKAKIRSAGFRKDMSRGFNGRVKKRDV